MRFSKQLEEETLVQLAENPDAHLVFDRQMYRNDGNIQINRDNLAIYLHRWLYMKLVGPLRRGTFLLQTCDVEHCQNPWHRKRSRTPGRTTPPMKCPNGHTYTAADEVTPGHYRCHLCAENRAAKRHKPRFDGTCRQGHVLAEVGQYEWVDKAGHTHYRCKKCTLTRVRTRRANARKKEQEKR